MKQTNRAIGGRPAAARIFSTMLFMTALTSSDESVIASCRISTFNLA
jgi:hypothetical protein